jgi:BlaI family transcriptional regulator, penicillinase repressor
MPRKTHPHPLDLPALELDCMKALWTLGEATVHGVRAHLLPYRPLAYTTVMTVMGRLSGKGMVRRRKRSRSYLYSPAVAEAAVRDHATERLTRDFFQGSRDELRRFLGGDAANPPPASASAQVSQAAGAQPAEERAAAAPAQEPIDPSLL